MLYSALLIHLTNGHDETHFHVFGSLAFLAFYRDWRVLATATSVMAAAQCFSGFYWPQSLYGDTADIAPHWRWLEHTAWALFEDVFLVFACLQGDQDLYAAARASAELQDARSSVEREVGERTNQIAAASRDLGRQIGEHKRVEVGLRAEAMELEGKVRTHVAEVAAAGRALKRQVDLGRRAEEELANSVGRYRFMTDSVPQIVWTARPDGTIDHFNRRFHEYTGLTVEELRQHGWQGTIHPDDQARGTARWQRAVETGETLDDEVRIRRGRDGAYRWHLSRAVPMRNAENQVIQWLGTCTDVDDQKRARETALRSEQRYRSLVAASAQIVWLLDSECRVTTDLPEWRNATGQSFEESAGYGWMEAIHPDDREHSRDLWRWALETRTVYENELRLRMHDGSYRSFTMRGVPVLESDGRIREWIGTSSDITDRKQAESVVRRAQEDLEARVKERTAQLTETNRILHQQVIERQRIEGELAEARDEALASAKLKSQFLANMSHEIRTPMNGVIGMTSLLLDTTLDEDQREYIETIRASGDALLSIINDILDFSKIEAGKLDFEELDMDLQGTVEGAIELLAEKAAQKGLGPRLLRARRRAPAVARRSGPAAPGARQPGGQRHQVYPLGPGAGPRGQAQRNGGRRADLLSGQRHGHRPERGSGARAFPGVRAGGRLDHAQVRRDGLGLAISKQLVELMGGEIGVESAVGQGSTFWFTVRLPKQPILLSDDDAPAVPLIDFSTTRTLIVGTSGTGEVLREQLTSWGMNIHTLTDGQEALGAMRAAAADGQPYHFVLADAQLPDLDGPALAHEVKGDPALGGGPHHLAACAGPAFDVCLRGGRGHRRVFAQAGQTLAAPHHVPLADADGVRARGPAPARAGDRAGASRQGQRGARARGGRQFRQPEGRHQAAPEDRVQIRRGGQRGGGAGGHGQGRLRRGADGLPDARNGRFHRDARDPPPRGDGRDAHADRRADGQRARRRPRALPGGGDGRLPEQAGQDRTVARDAGTLGGGRAQGSRVDAGGRGLTFRPGWPLSEVIPPCGRQGHPHGLRQVERDAA